ncbi:MAG: o-succinylbenzoate--CoA ligase [Betaproteobacteria bacterium]|nr:o-succinylbenzoate--CoA ligase [Betaproteobacteria bacterium]
MHSTMMQFPLTLTHIFERAGQLFGASEIVSRLPDKSLHRYRYRDFHERARALGGALQAAGLQTGDRVATLMWNHYAHLEAYFGIPCAGGVLHTLNLRLHADDIGYIANHAGDRFLIVDDALLPLYEKFRHLVKFERVFVVPLTGQPVPAGYESYEDFIRGNAVMQTPALDERAAAGMCYTSGTTGRPKGVVYSHRALVLHSMACAMGDTLGLKQSDSLCPVVPMFHVNAWGLPFTGVMVGCKLVLPGPHLDAVSLLDLYQAEAVTFTAGVPTIWMGILQALEKAPAQWKLTPGMRMVVGGAAAPESMIRAFDRFNLNVLHAWGMTETTPLGTTAHIKHALKNLPVEDQYAYRRKQGVPAPFVEVRAMTDEGNAPRDGVTMGELQVRGPWVAAGYYNLDGEDDKWTADGWFRTGDVATIDAEGYVRITDRTKDLIKSGGEWISSLEVENALIGHPAVQEAAVIGIAHPKWDERPLAVIVCKSGKSVTSAELHAYLTPQFAKFWLPDDYSFVMEIPRTSTGKMLKSKLREQFRDWQWS